MEKKLFVKEKLLSNFLLIKVVSSIIYFLMMLIIYGASLEVWLSIAAVCVLGSFALDICLICKTNIKIFSLAGLFLILSYFFYFGHVILLGFFGRDIFEGIMFLLVAEESVAKDSVIFSYVVISIITICIMIASKKEVGYKSKFSYDEKKLKIITFIICGISIPMRIKYVWDVIYVSITESYEKTLEMDYSGVYIQISLFYIIGFVLLLLCYRNSKCKARVILACEILFFFVSMISGGRINEVIGLCIVAIVYITKVEKVNIKKLIICAIIGMILLQCITVISDLRVEENITFGLVVNKLLTSNMFVKVLDEFGATIYSVVLPIEQVPDTQSFAYGKTYIQSLAAIGISFKGMIAKIVDDSVYMNQLYTIFRTGGSYIGELYYNFGYFSVIFAGAIGWMIGKISAMMATCLKKDYFIEYASLVMLAHGILKWVRGYFSDITRASVWGMAFVLVVYFISKRISVVNKGRIKNE